MVLPTANLPLFLTTAIVLAVLPGPGIFYVATRTLAGGRAEGLASSLGTALGGFVHVVAGAVGVSALVLASATLFGWLKLVGAAYLLWLGFGVVRSARRDAATLVAALGQPAGAGTRRAFLDGIVVEALNPKTAAFFLALLPQFVDPGRGQPALQFILLGRFPWRSTRRRMLRRVSRRRWFVTRWPCGQTSCGACAKPPASL